MSVIVLWINHRLLYRAGVKLLPSGCIEGKLTRSAYRDARSGEIAVKVQGVSFQHHWIELLETSV